ncbi:MAG: glycosyltransferase [archaeon]
MRTVREGAALRTPAISYDVPGLRDSVKDGKTGILCRNNPDDMAKSATSLFNDKKRLKEYTLNALKDSKNHTWDRSAKEFLSVMESAKTY